MNDGHFKLTKFPRNTPQEDLIADLKRVATELGKDTVTREEYDERGKFHSSTIQRRFKGWFTAIREAGLRESRVLGLSDEDYFQNIEEIWRRLGRQPKYIEVVKPLSKYCVGAYEKKYGSWHKALEAFIRYVNESDEQAPRPMLNSEPESRRRTARNISWRLRHKILVRDNCICRMCGASPAKNPDVELHVDHIHPWSKGGETLIENLQTLCSICNIGKSNVT